MLWKLVALGGLLFGMIALAALVSGCASWRAPATPGPWQVADGIFIETAYEGRRIAISAQAA